MLRGQTSVNNTEKKKFHWYLDKDLINSNNTNEALAKVRLGRLYSNAVFVYLWFTGSISFLTHVMHFLTLVTRVEQLLSPSESNVH